MSLNRICVIGNLTRDPEMKYTAAGVPVANMGIAVQRFTKNEDGDYDVDFFNIVAWRRTAEFASNYLKKGRKVSIDGRLQARTWVADDGTKRTAYEIVAENIQGLDKRADGDEDGAETVQAAKPARAAASRPSAASAPPDDIDESDPFADE